MIYKDQASYDSTPPGMRECRMALVYKDKASCDSTTLYDVCET